VLSGEYDAGGETPMTTTPTKFIRADTTGQAIGTPKVSPQIAWSDAGLAKIAQHMFSLMLRNVASDGFLFVDPNHPDPNDPQSFSLRGCIVAAPSSPANTPGVDQDYVYNWTRDAAITAIEIAAASLPAVPGTGVQPLIDYVNFAQTCQNNATPSLALASYTIRGLSRQWTEQTDGPALETLAILRAYDQLDPPETQCWLRSSITVIIWN
jgi:glucoamylase